MTILLHRVRALLLATLVLLLSACTDIPEGLQPVRGFVLERYLGTWYEAARLDHRFERGLSEVSAEYARNEDGSVRVLNRGYDAERDRWKEAVGRAEFIGDADTASLQVSFFGPFYGGYHVIALDPDYRWSIVSGPSRDYLWLLTREKQAPAALVADLIEKAARLGFPTERLIRVEHRLIDKPAGK